MPRLPTSLCRYWLDQSAIPRGRKTRANKGTIDCRVSAGAWGDIAFIEELPGATTQGNMLEETRTDLHEAVQLVLRSNRALAEETLRHKIVIREPLASIS
jgi:predicted RNase H-like HicB family nuclease